MTTLGVVSDVTDSMMGMGQTLAQTVSCVINNLTCSGGAGLP